MKTEYARDFAPLILGLGGGDPHSNQNGGTSRRDKYEVITLESGVTNDPAFAQWMNQKNATNLHLTVEFYRANGRLVGVHSLPNAKVNSPSWWPSSPKYYTGPTLGPTAGNDIGIEQVEISHEGLELVVPGIPSVSVNPPKSGKSHTS